MKQYKCIEIKWNEYLNLKIELLARVHVGIIMIGIYILLLKCIKRVLNRI